MADSDSDQETGITNVSSYCFNCEKQGITTITAMDYPYFKDLVVSSFKCDHCGYSDRKVDCLMQPKERGIHIELKATKKSDLNRTVVRQMSGLIAIPEIEFEYKPYVTEGSVITIELFLEHCVESFEHILSLSKPDDENYSKISNVLDQIKKMKNFEQPFTIIVDDPSGNSMIERVNYPQPDPEMWILEYKRTWDENNKLGIFEHEDQPIVEIPEKEDQNSDEEDNQIMTIKSRCPLCHLTAQIFMHKVDVPHFQQVLLSSIYCECCGYRHSDLMQCSFNYIYSATIKETGVRYTLQVMDKKDYNRELSDVCTIVIPELEFEIGPELIKGVYTTVEGLLHILKQKIEEYYEQSEIPADEIEKQMNKIMPNLDKMMNKEKQFTLIFDDMTGNSYIQNIMAPDPDPHLTEVIYKRSKEQDEFLCLNSP